MAKAVLKTKKNEVSVKDFLNSISDEQQRKDSFAVLKMMEGATGDKPKMWGSAIIGFGDVYLKYASGRELDWFKMGFSPRKNKLVLYGLSGAMEKSGLKQKLGKFKKGTGCLYINKLVDVDISVLKKILEF